jgi:uncharacterized membrane protein YbaN (DUF454 family)
VARVFRGVLLPTTIFLILAAWCFGRASPALRQRLLAHPRFGQALRAWEEHGAVSARGKRAAVLAMALSWGLLTLLLRDPLASGLAGACMIGVAAYLLTRPSLPLGARQAGDTTASPRTGRSRHDARSAEAASPER